MSSTVDDTFVKMLRSFSRRLALLERKAGRRTRGGSEPANVVTLERGDRIVPTGSVIELTGYTIVNVSGDAMYAGNYSIGINRAGWYTASAAVRWEDNDTGIRQLRIMSGSGLILAYTDTRPSPASPGAGTCSQALTTGPIYLTPSDPPIRVSLYQNSGVSLAVMNHSEGQLSTNFLRMTYLGGQG